MTHPRRRLSVLLATAVVFALVAWTTAAAFFMSEPVEMRSGKFGTRRASTFRQQSTAGQGGGIFYDGPVQPASESMPTSSTERFSSIQSIPSSSSLAFRQPVPLRKDMVIVGGGLAGLSAALYLSQMDPDRHVCILERESITSTTNSNTKTTVASMAAAGMLAPQSERLPSGPLLDLCLQSRRLYPDFVGLVETLAQSEGVQPYLWCQNANVEDNGMPPHSVGYVASGGFLAPAFAGDAVATWSPPSTTRDDHNQNNGAATATWLDETQVRELEPNLHPDVIGGWWFPEDASVDARRLTCSLRAACVAAGVEILDNTQVTSLDLVDGNCRGVWCQRGAEDGSGVARSSSNRYFETNSVLVANGAWMRQLLPVPLEPHKGQSLSLRMPPNSPPLLRRVLFAQDSYIVPKADGRIVIGATVEAGSYDPNVTPAGVLHILSHALQLVPGLADLPMEETWVGLRPTTPDKGPILGKTPWDNLFLAGGYWRNGVLLAPKTGQLLAALMTGKHELLSESDQALLEAFSWDRFTSPEGGATMAANARYAASMHPIHQRSTGAGVAAAVGTELGIYSTARAASEERQKDRRALFDSVNDDSLEQAAMLGRKDAAAFSYEKEGASKSTSRASEARSDMSQERADSASTRERPARQHVASLEAATTKPYEGSADALTVNSSPADDDNEKENLDAIYDQIRENKAKAHVEMGESEDEERPDPGFRIYHVDSKTGESMEVPPYTSPEEMSEIVANAKQSGKISVNGTSSTRMSDPAVLDEEGDSISEGYQAIQDARTGASTEDTAQNMRELRMRVRGETENLSINGATTQFQSEDPEMNDIYKRIRDNKAEQEPQMTESEPDEKPDPGFRVYHVDSETGESREVPPYTSPQEMMQLVAMDKASKPSAETPPNGNTRPESPNNVPIVHDNQQNHDYNEQTYDGYTAIQQANSRDSRQEELEAMRAARRQNRAIEEINTSEIGVQRKEKD